MEPGLHVGQYDLSERALLPRTGQLRSGWINRNRKKTNKPFHSLSFQPFLICSHGSVGPNRQGPGDGRVVRLPAEIPHRTGPTLQGPAGTVSPPSLGSSFSLRDVSSCCEVEDRRCCGHVTRPSACPSDVLLVSAAGRAGSAGNSLCRRRTSTWSVLKLWTCWTSCYATTTSRG